jgi:hypothetical protein
MSVQADLFRIPDEDPGAPETTILDYPRQLVSPAEAIVQVSGTDGLIPTELLQYQVTVNDEARPPSYIKRVNIGEVGASGKYKVQVAALDLSGNADGSPANVEIEVDGVAPEVVVDGERTRRMGEGEGGKATDLTWRMEDDYTAAEDLTARIELYLITDPTDLLAVEHVRTIDLSAGATSGTVEVEPGALYRAELHVADAVGNETVSAILLDASTEDGGCSAAGGGGGALPVLLALLAAYVVLGGRLSAARARSRARSGR